jgi:hypothetical protein
VTENDRYFINLVEHKYLKVSRNGIVKDKLNNSIGSMSKDRYRIISTYFENGKHRRMFVHRLVYLLYKGPIPESHFVIQKNGNKLDCRESNLILVSRSDVAKSVSYKISGSRNGRAKLSPLEVESIRKLRSDGHTAKLLSIEFNVSKNTILRIVNHSTYKVNSI